jgi:hypothetical protein
MLEQDHKIKSVARLVGWATLVSLEAVKWNVETPNLLAFVWRQIDDKEPWVLSVLMQNASECLHLIMDNLQKSGAHIKRGFEKKRKIMESEVTSKALKGIQIEAVTERIALLEETISRNADHKTAPVI